MTGARMFRLSPIRAPCLVRSSTCKRINQVKLFFSPFVGKQCFSELLTDALHALQPEVGKTSVLTLIKLHTCLCKVYHVNEC